MITFAGSGVIYFHAIHFNFLLLNDLTEDLTKDCQCIKVYNMADPQKRDLFYYSYNIFFLRTSTLRLLFVIANNCRIDRNVLLHSVLHTALAKRIHLLDHIAQFTIGYQL